MKVINRTIINRMITINNDIGKYSVKELINILIKFSEGEILKTTEYALLYIIRENFEINIEIFYKTIIEYDSLKFSLPKRNTRVSIEAFLDLFNITKDFRYINVMKKFNRITLSEQEYIDFKEYLSANKLKPDYVSIETKFRLARQNGLDYESIKDLKKVYDKYNGFSHANIFCIFENINYDNDLKDLIALNLKLVFEALNIVINHYNIAWNMREVFETYLNGIRMEIRDIINNIYTNNIYE